MRYDLYRKYGNYNKDGFFILDHEQWDQFAQNKYHYYLGVMLALMSLLVPFVGIIMSNIIFEAMGLSLF